MATDAQPTVHRFAVHLWKEEATGGPEYRGTVRDVRTDAFRGFREWTDLIAFMVARLEQQRSAPHGDWEEESDVRQ